MRQEEIQLAIRPRTLLECLDLAFLFCGRHSVGLLVTSAVGVIPITLINWQLLQNSSLSGYMGYLILSMEVPWATLLLTL